MDFLNPLDPVSSIDQLLTLLSLLALNLRAYTGSYFEKLAVLDRQ